MIPDYATIAYGNRKAKCYLCDYDCTNSALIQHKKTKKHAANAEKHNTICKTLNQSGPINARCSLSTLQPEQNSTVSDCDRRRRDKNWTLIGF